MKSPGVHPVSRVVAVLGLLAVAAVAGAQVTIRVDEPVISSTDRSFSDYLQPQLAQAFAAAETDLGLLLGENVRIAMSRQARNADASMSVIVTDSPEYSALVLQMSSLRDGTTAQPWSYSSGWGDNMHRTLSKAIVYLYLSVSDMPSREAAQPLLIADLATGLIPTTDLGHEAPVTPQALATDSRGDLLVAGNATIVRFDRFMNLLAKLAPPEQANQYSWAGRIAVSPSDMVYAQSITGGDLWEFSPQLPEARRIRAGGQSVASITVMDDGSIILHDQVAQNTVRVRDDRRQEITLTRGQYSYVRAISGGPDNTIWIWDTTTRMASISDPSGRQIDVLIPVMDSTEAAYIAAIAPYPNGDLLLASQNALHRVDESGLPVWSFSLSDHPQIGTLLGLSSVAFDANSGLIYLNDPLQGRIFQILDVEYARANDTIGDELGRLLELAEATARDPDDAAPFAARAEFYEERGAWAAAYHNWDLAAYLDPGDPQAEAGMERTELNQDLELARSIAEAARETLATIGRATAQSEYYSALAIYEQLLARDPSNWEIADEMDALISEFEQPTRPRERNRMPLTIAAVEIDDVFPSLSLYYRANPVGSIVLKNELDVTAREIEVTLEMSVMDFPTSNSDVGELAPGEEVRVPLFARLSERVLSQRGRLLVQPRVTVDYSAEGASLSVSEVTEIYAHSNTAITWDDSRKLAAFIMPDERIAGDFGSRYADVGDRAEEIDLSERLFRAARLADIVGALGINYVEDPISGISEILGSATVVDSVRYPRDTLRVEAGDCDDTTALLCTLYEATGIRTAILTSPGHVFMAFNTGEPAQNIWMFDSETTSAIAYKGTVWLPVETTILDQGFRAAWEEGSRLWDTYEPSGETEFLPVEDARELYEPIPTGDVGYDITDLDDPIAAGADEFYAETLAGIVSVLYERTVAELEDEAGRASGRQKVRTLNQAGVLHARFNEPQRAEQSFNQAIEINPDYTTSYINLANLRIIGGRPGDAIALLSQVTDRRPDSILANLLLAQANQMLGNQREAREYMVIVEEQAPALASQYPHLTGSALGRASEAAAMPLLPWPVEEE